MLQVGSLAFRYIPDKPVLQDISFSLPAGGHLSVMGSSGSGKSTLLKLLFGSLRPDQGRIYWEGGVLPGPDGQLIPGHEGFSYVSQEYDLNPYMRVLDYLRMYLNPHDMFTEEQRIGELLDLVQLPSSSRSKIGELSLGQQQRIALVKALLGKPRILLLDEPFTHVDAFQKNYLRLRIFPYLKDQGVTVVNATHESRDVFSFADSILVLKNGELAAFGPTEVLYHRPPSYYVASLFGLVNQLRAKDFIPGKSGQAFIYAEEIRIGNQPPSMDEWGLTALVERCFFQGSRYLLELRTSGDHLLYAYSDRARLKGERLSARLPASLFRSRIRDES